MIERTGKRLAQAKESRSRTRRAVVVVSVVVLLSMSGVAWAGPPSLDQWCRNFGSEFPELCFQAPVPQTGQALCYEEDGEEATCGIGITIGQDGHLQSGVEWPVPRFTINETILGEPDGTVTDNLTGLIWLRDANCIAHVDWHAALEAANSLASGDCGLSDGSVAGDWRLPNVRELQSLIHYGFRAPALPDTDGTEQCSEDGEPFFGVQLSWYWSSTTATRGTLSAWLVDFTLGNVNSGDKVIFTFHVWPVRGGQ